MAEAGENRYAALAAAIRSGGEVARHAMDELVRAERAHLAKSLWRDYPQLRDEIEDIVAETFERVWISAGKCACFAEDGSYSGFRALVLRQASYLALSALRKAGARRAKADVVSLDEKREDGRASEPAAAMEWERALIAEVDVQKLVGRLLAPGGHLTDRQRRVALILLSEDDEDANAAIAQSLDLSAGAAREAKRAVRERLRHLLTS